MKKFSFMIAFFVWMAVFFWALTFDIHSTDDRITWAIVFATLWSLVAFFGVKELTTKWK